MMCNDDAQGKQRSKTTSVYIQIRIMISATKPFTKKRETNAAMRLKVRSA